MIKSYHTIIIGNGLIGSAATRFLSELRGDVAVIGPEEPADWATFDGPFASHYDQRRLTQLTDRSKRWVDVTRMAMADYRPLEARTGISFYDPIGKLIIRRPAEAERMIKLAAETDIPLTVYEAGDRRWRDRFPAFDASAEYVVLYEPPPAGMLNPRAMRQAQLTVARSNGATTLPGFVVDVQEREDGVDITTKDGGRFQAQNVLITTGPYTNHYNLLPRPLDLTTKTEVVVLGEVSPADAARLKALPTLSYTLEDREIEELYMTPPVVYPDGKYYVKIGANSIYDRFDLPLTELTTWFQSGNSDQLLPALSKALQNLMPAPTFSRLKQSAVPLPALRAVTRSSIKFQTGFMSPWAGTAAAPNVPAAGENWRPVYCTTAAGRSISPENGNLKKDRLLHLKDSRCYAWISETSSTSVKISVAALPAEVLTCSTGRSGVLLSSSRVASGRA